MTDNNLNQVPESSQEQGENQVESQSISTNDAIAESFYMGLPLDHWVRKFEAKMRVESRFFHQVDSEQQTSWETKICFWPLDTPRRNEPEIALTINKKWLVAIKVTPYPHYEEFYYQSSFDTGYGMNEVAYLEMKNIYELLKTGEIPSGSVLVKKDIDAITDEGINDWVDVYTEKLPIPQDKKAQRRIEETAALETLTESLPIQTGTLTAYNPDTKKWVIASSTSRATCDVYFDSEDNLPNVWDALNYVKIKTVAFLTSVGQVKKVVEKNPTEEDETSSIVFVTPHDNSKTDVALKTGQNDFSEWDTVEFVANKADRIIAIQKK